MFAKYAKKLFRLEKCFLRDKMLSKMIFNIIFLRNVQIHDILNIAFMEYEIYIIHMILKHLFGRRKV